MSILVSNLALPFTAPPEEAVATALRRLKLPDSHPGNIVRRSVDARRGQIRFVYTVEVALESPDAESRLAEERNDPQIRHREPLRYAPPTGDTPLKHPPVIVGFGPAGMFAALLLARHGYRPIVLERGAPMEERVAAVDRFWQTGTLDSNSNVQFGEGGAGTFSDGKLTTRINDPRCAHILRELVALGAPPDILTEAKPHIGTDRLRKLVRALREEIIALGGTIRFGTSLESLTIQQDTLTGYTAGGMQQPTEALLLAPGHSARDTFAMLQQQGIPLESKPFSVGARIEHRQEWIDRALYGNHAGHPLLPPGEYQLSHRQGDRAVYTFCMCPGGVVVPAASAEGGVVTNGMSCHARDGENANAALVVSVDHRDFGGEVFDGLRFQQRLEAAAYSAGGGGFRAPAQRVGEFLRTGKGGNSVAPSYSLGVTEAALDGILPSQVTALMGEGLRRFGQKLRDFDHPGALLTGVETRTSSPVRIPRDDDLQCPAARGLYPCGEGAGYAGGILSAAVDGLRAAEAVMSRHRPFQ